MYVCSCVGSVFLALSVLVRFPCAAVGCRLMAMPSWQRNQRKNTLLQHLEPGDEGYVSDTQRPKSKKDHLSLPLSLVLPEVSTKSTQRIAKSTPNAPKSAPSQPQVGTKSAPSQPQVSPKSAKVSPSQPKSVQSRLQVSPNSAPSQPQGRTSLKGWLTCMYV